MLKSLNLSHKVYRCSVVKQHTRFYSSGKKVFDLLGLEETNENVGESAKEDSLKTATTTTPDTLDDLSTFGSILRSDNSKKHDSYNLKQELDELIKDISVDSGANSRRSRASVHDSEIFSRLFETIAAGGTAESNSTESFKPNKVQDFLAHELGKIDNFNFSSLQRDSLVEKVANVPVNYKENQEKKIKVVNALKPTFTYLKSVTSLLQYLTFIQTNVVGRFNSQNLNGRVMDNKPFDQLVDELRDSKDPVKPVLNKVTLPVLMEYFVRSLAREFQSPTELLSLFHSLKHSPLLYLRSCNADLYNLVLKITWDTNKNMEDIRAITKDMLLNGFPGDLKTIKILSEIKLQIMKGLEQNDKDLFIDKFEKYRYHYLVDIEKRMRWLTKNQNRMD